jgi:hypothetical protein
VFITAGPDGPQVTESAFEWDESLLRIEGVAWSARSENIRRSPEVALVIRDSIDSTGLVVYGHATLEDLDSERVIITVRPSRTQLLPQFRR